MRFVSALAFAFAFMGINSAGAALWNTNAGGVSCGTGCKTFTSTIGGLTLTARAYSTPLYDATTAFNVSGNWAVANLNVYSGGIGVANMINNEGLNNDDTVLEGTSPGHSVDNKNVKDIVVFELPNGVWDPEFFKLGWTNGDTDVQAWIGGGSTAIDFTKVCFTGCAPGGNELVADLGFTDIGSTMPIVPVSGAGSYASPGGASALGGYNVPLNSQANFNTTKTGRYL